jgi:hypothetical protein
MKDRRISPRQARKETQAVWIIVAIIAIALILVAYNYLAPA